MGSTFIAAITTTVSGFFAQISKMKKTFFVILFLSFCFSDAHAFLSKTESIDPKDYPFILLAEDLQVYKIRLDLSGAAEKARLKRWIDGAYDIKYEYDRRDSDDFHTLFFSVKLEIEKTVKKAQKNYREGIVVLTKASAAVGMNCKEIKNQVKWGDESYYAIREKDGNPVGLIFTTRYQNKVYTLIMAGLYSSDHSLISDLVLPKLQSIVDFKLTEK